MTGTGHRAAPALRAAPERRLREPGDRASEPAARRAGAGGDARRLRRRARHALCRAAPAAAHPARQRTSRPASPGAVSDATADGRRTRRGVPPAARRRLLRDAESVGRRRRAGARAARLPRARHDQRRLRVVAWARATTTCASTTCSRTCGTWPAPVDVPVNADFEGGFAVEPEQRGRATWRPPRPPAWPGLSIEDSTGDADGAALRSRARRGTHPRGPAGHRPQRHRRAAHRPLGGVHRRPARPGRDRARGWWPTPRPAPTACMRRASARPPRSPPWSRPWRPRR